MKQMAMERTLELDRVRPKHRRAVDSAAARCAPSIRPAETTHDDSRRESVRTTTPRRQMRLQRRVHRRVARDRRRSRGSPNLLGKNRRDRMVDVAPAAPRRSRSTVDRASFDRTNHLDARRAVHPVDVPAAEDRRVLERIATRFGAPNRRSPDVAMVVAVSNRRCSERRPAGGLERHRS